MLKDENDLPQALSGLGQELLNRTDLDLLEAIRQQINKDLNAETVPVANSTRTTIADWSVQVEAFLVEPSTDLQSVLYQADVPEFWAKSCSDMSMLARAIVVRCAQKVIMRRRWSEWI